MALSTLICLEVQSLTYAGLLSSEWAVCLIYPRDPRALLHGRDTGTKMETDKLPEDRTQERVQLCAGSRLKRLLMVGRVSQLYLRSGVMTFQQQCVERGDECKAFAIAAQLMRVLVPVRLVRRRSFGHWMTAKLERVSIFEFRIVRFKNDTQKNLTFKGVCNSMAERSGFL